MINKILLLASLTAMMLQGAAATDDSVPVIQRTPTWTEWNDQQVNEVNRFALHTDFFAYENEPLAMQGDRRKSANFLSLDGAWKFKWVRHADQRPTGFYAPDFDDSSWTTMNVPGIWEVNGYGDPLYINHGLAWSYQQDKNNMLNVPTKDNHVGTYRRVVELPADLDGKQVIAHFGSVTSNIYLFVNGIYVGYTEVS